MRYVYLYVYCIYLQMLVHVVDVVVSRYIVFLTDFRPYFSLLWSWGCRSRHRRAHRAGHAEGHAGYERGSSPSENMASGL
jgi:hypothetical protein